VEEGLAEKEGEEEAERGTYTTTAPPTTGPSPPAWAHHGPLPHGSSRQLKKKEPSTANLVVEKARSEAGPRHLWRGRGSVAVAAAV
jgi:hypothetical protein